MTHRTLTTALLAATFAVGTAAIASAENKPDDGRRSSFLLAYITAKSAFFSLVLLPVK